jgi:hypothetical protein
MDTKQPTPGFVGLGRVIWVAFGPMLLAVTTMHIVLEGTGWHTPADYVYFAILAMMILGRWLEVLGGVPQTSTGEPATQKDFYRYVVFVLATGLAIWIVANAFGNRGAA